MVFRIISPDNVSNLPTPTSNGVQGYFNGSFPYTTMSPDFANMVQEELYALGTFSGNAPAVGSNNQMLNAILQSFVRGRAQQYSGSGTSSEYYTFTAPANTYLVRVTCVGGGGGAGACSNTVNVYNNFMGGYSGGGGGAGGLVIAYVPVTPGQSYSIVAGGGGVGGTENNPPGSAGGTSSFNGVITSYGGAGAGDSQGFGHEGGNGGSTSVTTSAIGTLFIAANGGPGNDGNGYNIEYGGGNGGTSFFGSGSRAAVQYGIAATTPGSGGGGSYGLNTGTYGGNGAPGIVCVDY